MSRKSRQENVQKVVDKSGNKCPKCGSDLEVYISCCYDLECCGIMDSVHCTGKSCWWEIEGYFKDDDQEELDRVIERIN